MKTIAVIPARYGSERFPGKPLALVCGQPLIRQVAGRVSACNCATQVVVSTDDRRIAEAVRGLAVEVVVDKRGYHCGTERVAAVAAELGCADSDRVVNVQGDEPLVENGDIVGALVALDAGRIGTVASSTHQRSYTVHDVEVVPARSEAVEFVPATALVVEEADRAESDPVVLAADFRRCAEEGGTKLLHQGIYAFRHSDLQQFAKLGRTPRERNERLEQLRALENGWTIAVTVVNGAPPLAVNVPEDVQKLETQARAACPERETRARAARGRAGESARRQLAALA